MSSSNVPATELLELASEAKNRPEAITILYRILDDPASSSESLRIKEQAIAKLSDLLREESRGEDLRGLLTTLRPFFSLIPKDKTANIVRGIIDSVAKIPNTTDLQISLCKEMIDWTRSEKRTFLRQRVEARLAALLIDSKEYSEALILLSGLVKKVRRLDDKLFRVEIDLLESKLHFSLRNLPKAKAALTAARTAANAIYVPPAQQGTIDLQSGILHAEEKDYKTAYCYFFEAFEAFNALEDNRAVYSLKYMLLCKIMMNQADDVAGIISSKALKFLDPEFDAMKAVADAFSKSSLRLFKTALQDFKAQLDEDPVVHVHLSLLYATLLEQNMFRFAGTLDQGVGDVIFPATLETMNMGKKPYDVEDDIFVDPELEEDEIIESDIEFEGEIVVPDNDPPQKMGDSSVEVSEENREASQEAKSKAMEAISDGKLEEAIEHLTEAILLNPTSAILYATRASVYIKMKKPNAAIRDADAALQINPDCAKSYKSRGIALSMLGHWEKAADEFHIASYIDFDEEITTILKKVEGNAHKIVEHRRKYDTLRMEREDRKIERERKRRKAEAKLNPPAAYEIAKNEEIAYSSDRSKCMPGFLGGMPSGFPGEFSCRFPGGMPGWFPCGFSTGMLPGGFPFPGGGGGMQGECFGDGGAAGGGMPGGIDYSNISNIQDSELMLMAAVFKDPEAMAAIQDVIENPANLRKQRSNPKAEKLIAKMISKIAGAF